MNAVYKRLQRSRVVWLSLLLTAAPTGGYELNRYHIRTYGTGGHGIRFPQPHRSTCSHWSWQSAGRDLGRKRRTPSSLRWRNAVVCDASTP